jgi:type III secretion protein J
VAEALRVLNDLKLPRAPRLKTQNIAQQQGLIDTPQAERLRQMEAQEGDIEESLETMDGVVSASVELVVPPAPRPGVLATPSRASVLIRAQPDSMDRLTQGRADLKALVAGSVEGLKTDDVVLVLDAVAMAPIIPSLPENPNSFKLLAASLALLVSLLALGMLVLGLKFQKLKQLKPAASPSAPVSGPPPSAPVSRPIVSASVQKKVA